MNNNYENKVPRLKNFNDFGPDMLNKLKLIETKCLEYLGMQNYIYVDPPIIESADLFLRKSLGSTSSSTYTFFDQSSNQVSLRPDFTASAIRLIFSKEFIGIEDKLSKVCYSGPVFRFTKERSSSIQIHQVGAELLGKMGADSDAEILINSIKCLDCAGIENYKINLGHVGILREIMSSSGCNYSIIEFFMSNIEIFNHKQYRQELNKKAEQSKLLKSGQETNQTISKKEIAKNFKDQINSNIGLRTKNEILDRYILKLTNQVTIENFNKCIDLIKGILDLKIEDLIANSYPKNYQKSARLSDLKSVIDFLLANGVKQESMKLNFTLTRNLAYYNGIVFDLLDKDGSIIGGGGRYDDLPSRLGYKFSEGCLGFAINLTKIAKI